jgi:predicted RNA-binding Zn-ribbon protein involved in translation (DUF1610 family)
MSLFAGRSRAQREQVCATLRSLRSTTVEGLAATLAWSPRRTARVLRDVASHPEGAAVRYDRIAGTVMWSLPPPPPPPAPSAGPAAPGPAVHAAPALPRSWGASPRCPSCQVGLEPTGTGGLFCPHCGRLAPTPPSSRVAPAPTSAPSTTPSAPVSPSIAHRPPDASDRRAQEMFAAWVTARPIPCPKCRTPLRHRGVASYGCPACGAQIAFDRTKGVPASTGPAPSGPSGPSGPTL